MDKRSDTAFNCPNMHILSAVSDFINNLSHRDAAKILANLKFLETNKTEGLVIKQLKGKIYELVVNQYRVVFFKISEIGYVVDVFRKKSRKAPKRIIERAEKIYRDVSRQQIRAR